MPVLSSDRTADASPRAAREVAIVALAAAALSIAFTYPLVIELGHVGRVDSADGQFSIWNVAWVARTLVVDPLHVFDANIFYPHRWTLAYSENNLGAGILAIPAYWLTRNAYVAHNVVVLLGFTLSQIGMFYLARYLTGDRRAAAVSAICFAFCPYVLAWTAEIQLLMIAGLPFVMLAFHRMVDDPTPRRGAALGLAMGAETLCCGYYGVFTMLIVGYAVLVVATTKRMWTSRRFWIALACGAAVAVACVAPIFAPYVMLQRVTGFARPLDDAVRYSANWSAYFASSAYAHRWMLRFLPRFNGVLFPGFIAAGFGLAGIVTARRSGRGELAMLYGGLAVLAFWASFGPVAGLYAALYKTLPVFAWLRAPGRFGLIVVFGLSVLAGVRVADLARVRPRGALFSLSIAFLALAELITPIHWVQARPLPPSYQVLTTLPRGPLIEMPFYYREVGLFQHAKYMLASTTHWYPLVNGYSDYIPDDFSDNLMLLAGFPSREGLRLMHDRGVRYALFHMYGYNSENRADVLARLREYSAYLRPIDITQYERLYEIVGAP